LQSNVLTCNTSGPSSVARPDNPNDTYSFSYLGQNYEEVRLEEQNIQMPPQLGFNAADILVVDNSLVFSPYNIYYEQYPSSSRLSDLSVNIAPGIADSYTNISVLSANDPEVALFLTALNGQVIKSEILALDHGSAFFKLDLTDIPTGLYLISIKTASGFKAVKLIVRH
jgi:hypothetical protein